MSQSIDRAMKAYVENGDMAGGALLVRREGEILYEDYFGYADLKEKKAITDQSIFRMMSMTKCITAVAVMICVERGLLELDAPLSKYSKEFAHLKVAADPRYEFKENSLKKIPFMLLTFRMDKVKTKDAKREITIRDLLSHSSGIQQGMVGLLDMLKDKKEYSSLREYCLHFAKNPLDFQPGEGTGYSPLAGFDILGYVVSVVSKMSLEDFVQKEICKPLSMTDTTFFLKEEHKNRLVRLYKRKGNRLVDVTDTKADVAGFYHTKELSYEHGSGGLYSTLHDYDRFGQMLLNNGILEGHRVLQEESVRMLHSEGPYKHLEPEPGFVWGLGVKIRQKPELSECKATRGTYGWSGAFGTHFFISPKENLEVCFMTNRSDLNGSGSYISAKVEELVFERWGDKI